LETRRGRDWKNDRISRKRGIVCRGHRGQATTTVRVRSAARAFILSAPTDESSTGIVRFKIMSSPLTRRRFAVAALVTASTAMADRNVEADDADRKKPDAVDPARVESPPSVDPTQELAVEDLLLVALLRRYPPEMLNPERIAGIRAGLSRNLQQGDLLRRAMLSNSDEPATVFRARRW
jgi:hypothetical protein